MFKRELIRFVKIFLFFLAVEMLALYLFKPQVGLVSNLWVGTFTISLLFYVVIHLFLFLKKKIKNNSFIL